MAESSVANRWFTIWSLKDDVQRLCASVLDGQRPFGELSIRPPRVSPPELAFYQAVTWLYAYYYEAGRVTFAYLTGRLQAYNLDQTSAQLNHYKEVRMLRTFLQHNLNLESRPDLELQRSSENWLLSACGSAVPGNEMEWGDCLNRILADCETFLNTVSSCIRQIERDESLGAIVLQWSARLSRYHQKHEFENVVAIVVHDIGQDSLDPSAIVSRYYDKWSSDLRSRLADYDFEEEARKLVEQTLLNEHEPSLPITGEDIMKVFGIPPGREVGRLWRRARDLYRHGPTNRDALLQALFDSESMGSH